MKKSSIAAACLLIVTMCPMAAEIDGNWFYTQCTDTNNNFGSGVCSGFVTGFAEGISVQAETTKASPIICAPSKVTNGQKKDVFVKYLRDNPQQRHLNPSTLLALAFMTAWPCR